MASFFEAALRSYMRSPELTGIELTVTLFVSGLTIIGKVVDIARNGERQLEELEGNPLHESLRAEGTLDHLRDLSREEAEGSEPRWDLVVLQPAVVMHPNGHTSKYRELSVRIDSIDAYTSEPALD